MKFEEGIAIAVGLLVIFLLSHVIFYYAKADCLEEKAEEICFNNQMEYDKSNTKVTSCLDKETRKKEIFYFTEEERKECNPL